MDTSIPVLALNIIHPILEGVSKRSNSSIISPFRASKKPNRFHRYRQDQLTCTSHESSDLFPELRVRVDDGWFIRKWNLRSLNLQHGQQVVSPTFAEQIAIRFHIYRVLSGRLGALGDRFVLPQFADLRNHGFTGFRNSVRRAKRKIA